MQRLEAAFLSSTNTVKRNGGYTPLLCVRAAHTSTQPHRRRLHSTGQDASAQAFTLANQPRPAPPAAAPPSPPVQDGVSMLALANLPLSQVLRTYLITTLSSSPALLSVSTSVLRLMLESKSALFNVQKNPLLRWLLWETFYKQFCAGESKTQIDRTCAGLRQQGYAGVILEYALEVLKDAEGHEATDVAVWRKGLLNTIEMSQPGDFVGLKWSGMGPAALRRMLANEAPSERMQEAMDTVCQAAKENDISLLPAAEETNTLDAFFNWCMAMQRRYNTNGKAVVYNTYQAYLKSMPSWLSTHLETAREQNFVLGAKLVRGAYLHNEKRNLIHDTIEDTHHAYDSLAAAMIHRDYNHLLQPASETASAQNWPLTNVVLATHNANTVTKMQALRQTQHNASVPLTPLSFAQLQGMADEVSCQLLAAAKADVGDAEAAKKGLLREQVFKCTTWGTMTECLNYLLRRAAENKDAASRTGESRRAMQAELWRRIKGVFGVGA